MFHFARHFPLDFLLYMDTVIMVVLLLTCFSLSTDSDYNKIIIAENYCFFSFLNNIDEFVFCIVQWTQFQPDRLELV